MCELLIRVKDSPLIGDPVFDSKVTRRGDVIVVKEDGWPWGGGQEQHDFWRILKLPNVPLAVAIALESPEPKGRPMHRTEHFRMHSFDLEHPSLSPGLRAYLADDTRAQPFFESHDIDSVGIAMLFSRKPPIPDPGSV